MAAYLAYVALHSFVFTFQSTTLLKEWNGGDYSAFVKNPAAVDWSYGLVNLLIFAAGLGLVTLGSWLRARRRASRWRARTARRSGIAPSRRRGGEAVQPAGSR
jgi:hypothetical protein